MNDFPTKLADFCVLHRSYKCVRVRAHLIGLCWLICAHLIGPCWLICVVCLPHRAMLVNLCGVSIVAVSLVVLFCGK